MSPWLLVGLGNPGPEYAGNRHNIGFMVIDALAQQLSAGAFRTKFGGELCESSIGGTRVVLLKPQQYMNLSGQAVQQTGAFYKIAPAQTLVIHDEIDLPYETLRLKVAGGHGGHNGLRSITEHVGPAFLRLRCGVGKPASPGGGEAARERVVGHVLGDFSKVERASLPLFVAEAVAAVRATVEKGVTAAMNQVNRERPPK